MTASFASLPSSGFLGSALSLTALAATSDSFIKNVSIIQDKKAGIYESGNRYSMGGLAEQKLTGTNYYESSINPGLSISGGAISGFSFINSGRKIELLDALINTGSSVKQTIESGN